MPLTLLQSTDPSAWDAFLHAQRFRPFLQSWTMGEVYRDVGQEPLRWEVREDDGSILGICQAVIVPARRGRHLSVPYGPVTQSRPALQMMLRALREAAREHGCVFVRLSPFWTSPSPLLPVLQQEGARSAPLHFLAEHLWYLPLESPDPWTTLGPAPVLRCTDRELLSGMRATTRNLIRRAEKEGVTVSASRDPEADLQHFLRLHEETRKRHGFVPYSDAFFRAQVSRFSRQGEAILYLARYKDDVIAASIHMRIAGETSYHHGASTAKFRNIPASYLLQWTAITDALARGDRVYNFWGVSPEGITHHPFAGVRTFKTGFGGKILELAHCMDIPLSRTYLITWGIEMMRKWRRGF